LGESIVSNADGNQPDPNELNLPGDEEQLGDLEELDLPDTEAPDPLADLGDLDLPDAGDPLADLDQPAGLEAVADEGLEEVPAVSDAFESLPEDSGSEVEQAEPEASDQDAKPKREPGEGIGMSGLAVFGVCGLSVLLLLALDVMVFLKWGFLFMLLMNVFWLMATAIPFIMWMGRKTLNFYEVVLGVSLAGIIVAVSLLLVEMVDYEGEVKPKSAASAVQLGSVRTIAVA
jgi:uncharacterized integral membrane protein